ncbi:type IV secretory system conjugative DNA transfer family protein [Pseudochrobactrum saccharolyticum]|uniref:type IV secretory system conjugative DNA transfer family protein n=1 Tax=Pseudochrobactrum saccharolyticum TaxID=354352 RepID=UPI00274F309A|nr:type IV secretory system conjugative DNA transfer family protein [Pseudochrobactrum saccharolyticum]MDP8250929.1 type IV secretory system conjugative DNA transfer family protein [Pseudochrobactrum saccharolyticum]
MSKPLSIIYIIFCLFIAFILWMLFYGIGLAIFFKDGRVLKATISDNFFASFKQVWFYYSHATVQKVALGAIAPTAILTSWVCWLGLRKSSNPLGDAEFQTLPSLIKNKWFQKKGHLFGRMDKRLLRRNDDRHHLIMGPTRSGKGISYVIPNALTHEGSMIVTDLKGEIFERTAGYRRKNGNSVYFFAPGSENTNRWNPIDFIRESRGDRTTDIQNMANILIPESQGENAVFQGLAQQLLAGIISYMLDSPHYENHRNLAEVNSFINSGLDLQKQISLILKQEPYLSRFTQESFNSYLGLSDRVAASTLVDIQNAMRPFKNERIASATTVTDIDLKSMKRKPVTVYLAPKINDVSLLKPLLTLFVQQVLDLLTLDFDEKSLQVYFLLDEFRQLKKMSEVINKLPYVAGYNIKMAFVIQDLKNLDEIYGETSRYSLLGNCGYQICLAANDQATAEYFSKSLGRKTIRYQSESRTIELIGVPRRTKVEQIRERDLMMPQEVRQMPADRMILLPQGEAPIFGQKIQYFKVAEFNKAVEYSQSHMPVISALDYYVPLTPIAKRLLAEPKAPVEEENTIQPAIEETPAQSEAPEAKAPPPQVAINQMENSKPDSETQISIIQDNDDEQKSIVDQDEIEDQRLKEFMKLRKANISAIQDFSQLGTKLAKSEKSKNRSDALFAMLDAVKTEVAAGANTAS